MEALDFGSEETIALLFIFGTALIVMMISLLPIIFCLCSLQKALGRCAPHNRLMQPGLVWLMLIPFFGIIWQFFVVINIADSLDKEFAERNIVTEPSPGKSIGMAMCILNVCSIVPYLGVLVGLAAFICWIIYWIKIVECSRMLAPPVHQPIDTFDYAS